MRTTDDTGALPNRHHHHIDETVEMTTALEVEKNLLMVLCDASLDVPSHSKVIADHTCRLIGQEIDLLLVEELIRKFAAQKLLSIRFGEGMGGLFVSSVDFSKLSICLQDLARERRCGGEDEEKNKQNRTVASQDTGDIENSSNMATNPRDTSHQLMNSGPLQQPHVPGWYCDYGDNSSITAVYPGNRQGPINRVYSLEPYAPTSILDTSHISGQSFPSNPSIRRVDPNRPYLDSSTGNILPVDMNRHAHSSLSPERNMPARSFSASRNGNNTIGDMLVTHASVGSGNAINGLSRPYIPITGTDIHVTASSLLSEMPTTSSFPYPAIPYTLTAPPPAPSASAVASTPYAEVSDVPSFDMTGPVMSYPWSVTGDLIPTAMSSIETKPSSKKVKTKSNSSSGRKRFRRPELWKKNVTKSKKLKGEEHVSRTGSVIPAKQVEQVDCTNCSFKCHENFNEDLRRQLFDVFYSLCSNESQKQFVCQNVQESATKLTNTSKKDGAAENKRKVCRKYFLPNTDNTRLQVCSKFFCRTLAIGKTFITHALRNKQFGCYVGKEKRGKPHNKIPDVQLVPARQHISSLLAGSSSGSKKTSKKKLLEQGMNITKMYEMYKQECAVKNLPSVTLSMYRRIFHTEF